MSLFSGCRSALAPGELPVTVEGFHVAHQEVGESLDDWSDRALTLSTTAFRDMPYTYRQWRSFFRVCLTRRSASM
ncbi:hypothetical protein DPMN_084483 [Dreissena polymorpha]|uniref:Uncharacterized protein n=1 Tax=Dreissena polymorpha TaxID=45954 RepID=A0A9D4BJF2_DREPO|nr:hypothetical protein DPMN_084483 [Dreissena polymorpha]